MENMIERMLLAGAGVIALTKEKAEKIVDDLVKKGEIAKKDQPKFVKKLLERGKDTRVEIEAIIEKTMTNVLNKLNIPTKTDIDALMKKIDHLAKKK
ncbi:phasin family protein [candidate division WOR-3 bacterium]|nr:phasin family protein [candidate division WOR-3 bacterium]MCK4528601.1 phasin family protein [candidate division WOR-3 bacterium]